MVCYRDHQLSMTNTITGQSVETRQECASADISVPWVIRQMMIDRGMERLSRGCLHAAVHAYARHAVTLGVEACEESLCRGTEDEGERNWVRARMSAAMGDISYWQGDLERAKKFYRIGLRKDAAMARVYAKLLLLAFGTHEIACVSFSALPKESRSLSVRTREDLCWSALHSTNCARDHQGWRARLGNIDTRTEHRFAWNFKQCSKF